MTLVTTVYDSNGNLLGDGPISSVQTFNTSRVLDGVGQITATFPITDQRALTLLDNEREIRVYRLSNGQKRELGRGIIRDIGIDYVGPKTVMKVSGPDSLDYLTRRLTGRYETFDDIDVNVIIASLLAKQSGWSATVDPGLGNQSVRFGGANLFKSLTTMADHKGVHVRLSSTPRVIEFGAFGVSSGVLLTNAPILGDPIYQQTDIIQITKLSISKNSKAVVTRARIIGSGEGVAAVTLGKSTRTSPYTIQSVVEGGQTEYFIDSPNISQFGIIERYVTFKDIVPIGNSISSQINASNELYDAGASWLPRNDRIVQEFKVTGIQPRRTLRPGDKISVKFTGWATDEDGRDWRYVNVDDDFWVMSVSESVSGLKSSLDLVISNIDSLFKDPKQVLVDAIDAINVQNIQVKLTPFMYENTYTRYIEADDVSLNPNPYPAKFILRFSKQVTDVTSILLHVRTFPLMSWLVLSLPQINVGSTPTPAMGVLHTHQIPQALIGGSFSLQENDQYPTGLSLKINGTDYTISLGGPWAPTNVQTDFDIDLTDVIKAQPGGFQRTHDIWFYPTQRLGPVNLPWSYYGVVNGNNASHGFLEANFNVQGVCQAIIPT